VIGFERKTPGLRPRDRAGGGSNQSPRRPCSERRPQPPLDRGRALRVRAYRAPV
jgi:hypothetical protein